MTRHAQIPAMETVKGVAINAVPGRAPVLVDGADTVSRLIAARCAADPAGMARRGSRGGGPWPARCRDAGRYRGVSQPAPPSGPEPAGDGLGTVDPALPGRRLRIAGNGEIQAWNLANFKGYLNLPDKTAETYTEDGWLRTGDIGRIEDGFLTITGRLKDIILTAGGKNITPAEIESRLKFSHYISDAGIIGDRRKYLTALIMIDQENVEKFAQTARVPYADFASLTRAPQVQDLIRAEIDQVNREFARVEQIKDFRLIDVLLTATMKLKRSFVEKKPKALIDDMYRYGPTTGTLGGETMKSRFKANAAGGVHGRQIKFVVEDHGYQLPKPTTSWSTVTRSLP